MQLQKSLFLLGKKLPEEVGGGFYDFTAYDYGPFSPEVYNDADLLAAQGLVGIEKVSGFRYRQYAATAEGVEKVEGLAEEVSERTLSFLRATVQWIKSVSFRDLLLSIYRLYPEYKENSVFRDS
ncbi:hypothetical protein ACGF5M_03100 [Gemmatimonadota bacterium]